MKKQLSQPIKVISQSVDEYESRFKRAKSEDTLDVMYQGACNNAKLNFSDKELTRELINIEVALDRCQQAFDTTQIGLKRKIDHQIKQKPESSQYNPAEEMRKMLSSM